MSWDIYGNPLRRGHCEVHPSVAEEYPCSVCLSASQQHEQVAQQCSDCAESEHYLGRAQERIKVLENHCKEQLAALEGLMSIVGESRGVDGYHLNGDVAEWDEFEEIGAAVAAINKAKGE